MEMPCKHNGKSVYPHGEWSGTYFSEELKFASEHGYEFEILSGVEFEKDKIFNEYVDHFYKIKATTSGAEKYIAKLHLNCLYGVFGRRLDQLSTRLVKNENLLQYLNETKIKNILEIDNEHSVLIIENNVSDMLALDEKYQTSVRSNVAIAAAITAYGRIHMAKFKLKYADNLVYSDTDSIFITTPLDPSYIGDQLGMMKDELSGDIIDEMYVLGIKRYGYISNYRSHSVIAGVKRDSLSLDKIKELAEGGSITVENPTVFVKSIGNLNISIKPRQITLKMESDKPLIGNDYIPHVIFENLPYGEWEFKIRNTSKMIRRGKDIQRKKSINLITS